MVKKTLTYHDFDGNERTKDFYFSMNQTEFGLLNNSVPGGLENYIKRIQDNRDTAKLLDLISMFIADGYGERGDNDVFYKKDKYGRKLGEAFLATEACDNLIESLIQDGTENGILSFLIAMLPTNIRGRVETEVEKYQAANPVESESPKIEAAPAV